MTNIERQKRLDQQKWFVSEKEGKDQSGNMDYCLFCCYRSVDYENDNIHCDIDQDYKEENCVCAKEYNRMIRARSK